MRIERVEVITLKVPWGPDDRGEFREWPVVRLHAGDGRVGMGRGGDARLIRAEFEELLVGQDPARISLHWQRMFDKAWRFRGPGRDAMTSICGIDVALWDLLGQAALKSQGPVVTDRAQGRSVAKRGGYCRRLS